jgi:hypothetical protein
MATTVATVTVSELAESSGRHEKTIRRAITTGRLPATKDEVSGQYLIPVDAGYALYPPREPKPEAPVEIAPEVFNVAAILPNNPAAASWAERAVRAETTLKILAELIGQGADGPMLAMVIGVALS